MTRLAVTLGAMLAMSSCKKSVDTADFAKRLEKRTAELGIADAKVTCPTGISPKQGTTFVCNVVTGGKTYELEATITKAEGKQAEMDTKWKAGAAVISAKLEPALADELTKQMGTPIKIACGEPLKFLDAERKVRCDFSSGATKSALTITFNQEMVPTDWKLDPPVLAKAKLETMLNGPVRAKFPSAAVTCGTEPLLLRPADGILMCDAVNGDTKGKLKAVVNEQLGIDSWEILPP